MNKLLSFFKSHFVITKIDRYLLPVVMILLLAGCTKEKSVYTPTAKVEIPTTDVNSVDNYVSINDPGITLSNYTYVTTATKDLIGKIYPASKLTDQYKLATADAANFYIRNDSLFITAAGKLNIINKSFIDINLLISTTTKSRKTLRVVYDQFATNKIVAHRGAWAEYSLPENSLASLKQAIKMGCQGSEFDVHLTTDKVLVVCHDDIFQGLTIETSTYNDLLAKKISQMAKRYQL